jgi:ATP-dependent Lon protease, bacterial type
VPLEAVRRHQVANPLMLIDEIDKAGGSRNNGALTSALMPFLNAESARAYPDPFVQSECDLSWVNYVLTANDDTVLPDPLRDRLWVIRLPRPTIDHLPALARAIVADFAREQGADPRWWPPLEDHELAIAEELWAGGSVRRLRNIVERLLAYREERPRN